MEKNAEIVTTDQELKNFCSNVRFIRKCAGFTQKQMAAIMGIGVKSLRKIESGVLPPRFGVDALCNLCDALHIPPRILFADWGVLENPPVTSGDSPL